MKRFQTDLSDIYWKFSLSFLCRLSMIILHKPKRHYYYYYYKFVITLI